MPIETISSAAAIEALRNNPFNGWPARGDPGSRLEPMAQPAFKAGVDLSFGEPIFTIGSCFARNVENALAARGFPLPARDAIRADPAFGKIGFNILNNYGVPSIYNELLWALEPDQAPADTDLYFEALPGKFVDVHLNNGLRPEPLEMVKQRRTAISNAYRGIRDCRVAIITLGLAEVWFDERAKVYINVAPRKSMIKAEPDRYTLHVMSYSETVGYLDKVLALLDRHLRADHHVILTVSPVPLQSTWRDCDVMVANSYSKSVLRAAAEEIVQRSERVTYYPSFESVLLTDRPLAWLDDNVHPTHEVVSLNCERMVAAYCASPAETLTADEFLARVAALGPGEIFGLLENRQDLIEANGDIALAFARATATRTPETALAALAFVGDAGTATDRALLTARIMVALDRPAEALALLTDEPPERPLKAQFFTLLTRANLALGHRDEARTAAGAWARLAIRTAEPYRLLARDCSANGEIERADNYFRQALDRAGDDPGVLLDYAEHLDRHGRHDEWAAIVPLIEPANPSQVARLERLGSDL